MIFGEFVWQNGSLIDKQICTNLTGTMNVTKEFISQIIKSQGIYMGHSKSKAWYFFLSAKATLQLVINEDI